MRKTIYPSMLNNEINRSIMVVGAHADDNEINAGGTMLKYHALGYEIIYVQATNNMSGRGKELKAEGTLGPIPPESPDKTMARRKAECADAAAMVDTTPIHLDYAQRHYTDAEGTVVTAGYGTDRPEGVQTGEHTILTACGDPDCIAQLADLIVQRDPEVIFTHGIAQRNVEHFCTGLLTANAYWLAVEKGYQGALLQWQESQNVHGEHSTRWETFIDYTAQAEKKWEFIGKHFCQKPTWQDTDFGHRFHAQMWGSACGCGAAEVFNWVSRPRRYDRFGPWTPDLTLELMNNSR